MKIFTLLLLLSASLFAVNINESLLKIHATLLPKISMMDYKFEDKLQNNAITIAIMYKSNQYKDAQLLKNKIEARYRDGIKSYRVKPKLVPYQDIKKAQANIYYLFPTNKKNIQKTIKQANKNSALTFSYSEEDLKYGVMISLDVSKKIKPILNLDAIKTNKISVRPILIDISNIYTTSVLNDADTSGYYNTTQVFEV